MAEKVYEEQDIRKVLDDSLRNKENCKISGSTGSGKTAIVKAWLEENKQKVNGIFIDGCTLRVYSGVMREKNGLMLIGQLFSNEMIDNITSLPNRVVVVDNYHLLDWKAQNHLLLLCDHLIVDEREADGFKELDNIEFVCAILTE